MLNDTHLQTVLQDHLHWNRARIVFIVAFVLALMKVTTVNLSKVANALGGTASNTSNYRRIQRFFSGFIFDYNQWSSMVLRLLPIETAFVVSIDRTNWRFGRFEINILMAALVYKSTAYPLVWMLLDKAGNSNTDERIALVERLLVLIPCVLIKAVVADREFIGKQWFKTLDDYGLPYYIRIRQNARVSYRGGTLVAKRLFRDLAVGQARHLRKPRLIYGQWVFLAAMRLDCAAGYRDDFLLVVSNTSARPALSIYRLRWGIEVLFAALKSRGFNFEETHLVDSERIEKLVALLALAFTWAHLVGQWLAHKKPLVIKNHGRPGRSLFRLGLDRLQYVLLNQGHQRAAFADCVWVLIAPLLDLKTLKSAYG